MRPGQQLEKILSNGDVQRGFTDRATGTRPREYKMQANALRYELGRRIHATRQSVTGESGLMRTVKGELLILQKRGLLAEFESRVMDELSLTQGGY